MPLNPSQFNDLAKQLADLNKLSPAKAQEFMALIGDTPRVEDDGLVVITDANGETHRLKFPGTADVLRNHEHEEVEPRQTPSIT